MTFNPMADDDSGFFARLREDTHVQTIFDLKAERARLRERISKLEAALQFAIDGWDNQDINHAAYRVEVFKAASDALASSDFVECPTCMRRWKGEIHCALPTCSLRRSSQLTSKDGR